MTAPTSPTAENDAAESPRETPGTDDAARQAQIDAYWRQMARETDFLSDTLVYVLSPTGIPPIVAVTAASRFLHVALSDMIDRNPGAAADLLALLADVLVKLDDRAKAALAAKASGGDGEGRPS